jgi:hypothetical protein
VSVPAPRHIEGGGCWCDDMTAREVVLDLAYPGRCQALNGPGEPSTGERTCVYPDGHSEPHCGYLERPGDSCHFCGGPTPTAHGENCPTCWTSLEGMPLADVKALFATADLSIDLPSSDGAEP